MDYIYYYFGYDDEIQADERQKELRFVLHKQIKFSDFRLRKPLELAPSRLYRSSIQTGIVKDKPKLLTYSDVVKKSYKKLLD
jgi:hypothetical protein